MADKVAIIGWGSLLWDLDNLEPHVHGEWAIDRGPTLPLEFVRVSPKRLNALTVVIDRDHGMGCPTSYRLSRRSDVVEAAGHLAARERAVPEHIGFTCLRTGRRQSRLPETADVVAAWLEDRGLDAAVWTDLEGNFRDRTGQDFSLDTAVAYLRSLSGPSLVEAKRYIASAPSAVDTPLRRRLEDHAWWRAIAF
jgi:hypothetical protein